MGALDALMQLPEVEKLRGYLGPHDAVAVIRQVGSQDNPVRAYLTPPTGSPWSRRDSLSRIAPTSG
jgi:hypothetical protein